MVCSCLSLANHENPIAASYLNSDFADVGASTWATSGNDAVDDTLDSYLLPSFFDSPSPLPPAPTVPLAQTNQPALKQTDFQPLGLQQPVSPSISNPFPGQHSSMNQLLWNSNPNISSPVFSSSYAIAPPISKPFQNAESFPVNYPPPNIPPPIVSSLLQNPGFHYSTARLPAAPETFSSHQPFFPSAPNQFASSPAAASPLFSSLPKPFQQQSESFSSVPKPFQPTSKPFQPQSDPVLSASKTPASLFPSSKPFQQQSDSFTPSSLYPPAHRPVSVAAPPISATSMLSSSSKEFSIEQPPPSKQTVPSLKFI